MSAEVLPRAIARTRRLDLRVVVGLLLFVVGILATSTVIRQARERTPVLVATRSIQPGETLAPGDLRVADLGLSSGVMTVSADEIDAVVGLVVVAPLGPGQVLSPGSVADGPALGADEVAISVGVLPSHAAGGSLRPGDRVMVLATEDPGRSAARTTILLSDIAVVAVDRSDSPGVASELTVTLEVSQDDAPAIAQAANSGILDLVLMPAGGSS